MQELPTNKPNFPFKHTQDVNQTRHVAPYEPIVFNDNICFYFNSLSSVQDVLKESCYVYVTVFYDMPQNFWVLQLNMFQKIPLTTLKKMVLVLFHNFLFFKMAAANLKHSEL